MTYHRSAEVAGCRRRAERHALHPTSLHIQAYSGLTLELPVLFHGFE